MGGIDFMDFSKLNANEKLATYGAVASIVGAVLSLAYGGGFGALSGILMLVIVFLPQISPTTKLPGSKGSLMMIVGGVSALGAVLALLALMTYLAVLGSVLVGGIGLIASVAGGLLMGWASWREFQSEGGKFQIGTKP
jgi:hypothetical protein